MKKAAILAIALTVACGGIEVVEETTPKGVIIQVHDGQDPWVDVYEAIDKMKTVPVPYGTWDVTINFYPEGHDFDLHEGAACVYRHADNAIDVTVLAAEPLTKDGCLAHEMAHRAMHMEHGTAEIFRDADFTHGEEFDVWRNKFLDALED